MEIDMNAKLSSRKYNALASRSQWACYERTWAAIIERYEHVLANISVVDGLALIEASQASFSQAHSQGYRDSKA
jgi:hypothetical protein